MPAAAPLPCINQVILIINDTLIQLILYQIKKKKATVIANFIHFPQKIIHNYNYSETHKGHFCNILQFRYNFKKSLDNPPQICYYELVVDRLFYRADYII